MALDQAKLKTDLLGGIKPELFGESAAELSDRLDGYITKAAAKVADLADTAQYDAALKWCEYLAFADAYRVTLGKSQSETVEMSGSKTYNITAQLSGLGKERDRALEEYNSIANPPTAGQTPTATPNQSRAIPVKVNF